MLVPSREGPFPKENGYDHNKKKQIMTMVSSSDWRDALQHFNDDWGRQMSVSKSDTIYTLKYDGTEILETDSAISLRDAIDAVYNALCA